MTSVIDFLKDQNVFVFDTETTGLPEKTQKWGTYWDYKLNKKYDGSRIVSIAWSQIEKFNKNNIINDINNIQHHLRYPEGFKEILNTNIHGISYEDILKTGLPFSLILNNMGLAQALLDADYIVAHNVGFDYHILMNELYRIVNHNVDNIDNNTNLYVSVSAKDKANLCIEHLENLKNNGKLICSGKLSTNICKISFPTSNIYLGYKTTYKMPKLCELYKYYFGFDFENAHSAAGDVKALLECLVKM